MTFKGQLHKGSRGARDTLEGVRVGTIALRVGKGLGATGAAVMLAACASTGSSPDEVATQPTSEAEVRPGSGQDGQEPGAAETTNAAPQGKEAGSREAVLSEVGGQSNYEEVLAKLLDRCNSGIDVGLTADICYAIVNNDKNHLVALGWRQEDLTMFRELLTHPDLQTVDFGVAATEELKTFSRQTNFIWGTMATQGAVNNRLVIINEAIEGGYLDVDPSSVTPIPGRMPDTSSGAIFAVAFVPSEGFTSEAARNGFHATIQQASESPEATAGIRAMLAQVEEVMNANTDLGERIVRERNNPTTN